MVPNNGPRQSSTKNSMAPQAVRNGPNTYTTLIHRLIDWSVSHGRYRRSVRFNLLENTVDINGRFDYTYGELRSIVDRR